MKKYTRLLTIAGSDSGGGAGIQADLKTFSACGCFGMTAVTAITAQNTCGVTDIHPVPVSSISAQVRAVLDDIGVDAIKIGMLHSAEVIECVADVLTEYGCSKVVLDPVMVATSGDKLIEDDAVDALKEYLFPAVQLITPNIPEAELLVGKKINSDRELEDAAQDLAGRHSLSVLLKAGHFSGTTVRDILVEQGKPAKAYSAARLETRNTHGTGCTLSSAVAAFLGKGSTMDAAVEQAESYLHGAIEAGSYYELGKGHGPVHHFHSLWKE